MTWTRAALAAAVAVAVAMVLVSGGHSADPRTPAALPGVPPPFLGTAVVGSGELTAAIDAYGDVVDLRARPAGGPLIDNPSARQAAGTVPADTGIVPRLRIRGGPPRPFWEAERIRQRYRPGTNVVVVEAEFPATRAKLVYAARGALLACRTWASAGARVTLSRRDREPGSLLHCDDRAAAATIRVAERSDRSWLARARPLGEAAPAWALAMYRRSLLTLRALTDRRSGAAVAGARDGWAYVWPRDAGTTALALAAAGYEPEARRVARFLLGLDLGAAARFDGDGGPVPGREAQGDASGWVTAAARASGLPSPAPSLPWRDRSDYQEGAPGTYLANAIASFRPMVDEVAELAASFGSPAGLAWEADDPGSGLDSAAAWAVRPFPRPALFPAARRTLLTLAHGQTRFGITPGESWAGIDPWAAPTAWSAWSLAALSVLEQRHGSDASAREDRRAALGLLAALRRAATPAGALPERVDASTGIPTSTTPLAWPHAFAILTLHQLWP